MPTAAVQAHNSAVTCLALAGGGWHLLSGGRDGIVVLWDLRTHAQLAVVPVYEAVEGGPAACGKPPPHQPAWGSLCAGLSQAGLQIVHLLTWWLCSIWGGHALSLCASTEWALRTRRLEVCIVPVCCACSRGSVGAAAQVRRATQCVQTGWHRTASKHEGACLHPGLVRCSGHR